MLFQPVTEQTIDENTIQSQTLEENIRMLLINRRIDISTKTKLFIKFRFFFHFLLVGHRDEENITAGDDDDDDEWAL